MTERETLEVRCPVCDGQGYYRPDGSAEIRECFACDGAGFKPTELGRQVLELMRHNLRPMFQRMQNGED
jgi:DnaJ-class molecular chaperone